VKVEYAAGDERFSIAGVARHNALIASTDRSVRYANIILNQNEYDEMEV
jgi:hypothetical protein